MMYAEICHIALGIYDIVFVIMFTILPQSRVQVVQIWVSIWEAFNFPLWLL